MVKVKQKRMLLKNLIQIESIEIVSNEGTSQVVTLGEMNQRVETNQNKNFKQIDMQIETEIGANLGNL